MTKTILVVDGDERLRQLAGSVLQKRGHQVHDCASGAEALDLITACKCDLAIVGEKLTDSDGISWIVKLRKLDYESKVLFVCAAWPAPDLYQVLTKELGVSLVAQRPLKSSLFAAQVDALFGAGQSGAESIEGDFTDEDQIPAMRTKYIRILPSRVERLRNAVNQANASPGDDILLAEAVRLSHNLKGTASSVGCPEIGGIAAVMESSLSKIKDDKSETGAEKWKTVLVALKDIQNETDSLRASVSRTSSGQAAESYESTESGRIRILMVTPDRSNCPVDRSEVGPSIDLVWTSDPAEAVRTAKDLIIDAAFIDLTGGRHEVGLELALQMRNIPNLHGLPLAFICERCEQEHPIELAHAGASFFLKDPVTAVDLKRAVKYLMAAGDYGRPRILVVDDDEDFASIIAEALAREGMMVQHQGDPLKILETMDQFRPELVLLDVMMPAIDGFDLCRMVRSSARWQDVPIVFLTAQTGIDARVKAFDSGGDDYLPKPIVVVELLARVKARLERARLLKERIDLDALTGLYSRRAFVKYATALLAETSRYDQTCVVTLIDVDHFKKVNDTYGHLCGDRVLSALGQLITKRYRLDDLRGRWGGEEFVLALRHASIGTATGALSRLLEEFRALEFKGDHGEVFQSTFSAGIASFGADGKELEELLRVADRRLYLAKNLGRNQVVSAEGPLQVE